ncbi:MAG: hypothetical protein LBV41_01680 [Cytophagaceae bacterium]|jgi:hypothetical protein|nr:hypothetical protein [Cytophagaceae bacterium]
MNRFENLPQQNFAFTSDAVKFMQDAYGAFAQLARLAGPNCIISGCVLENKTISSGWIVLNGELLYFPGMVYDGKRLWAQKKTVTNVVNVAGASRTQTVELLEPTNDWKQGMPQFYDPNGVANGIPKWYFPRLNNGGMAKLGGLEAATAKLGGINFRSQTEASVTVNGKLKYVSGVSVILFNDDPQVRTAYAVGQSAEFIPSVSMFFTENDTAGTDGLVSVMLRWNPNDDWKSFQSTDVNRGLVTVFFNQTV